MTELRKAAEMALEALESLDCGDTYKTHNAASALRQALAMERFSEVSQEIEEALKQPKREWVGLTEDEIQETGQYSYCRGGTSEKLYHIMWNSQPSASVGWCREELIAFAQTIEARLKEKNT